MTVSARLVSLDGTELLRFGAFEAYALQRLELGYPDIRDSITPIPGRDGEFDTTTYHGASAITMDLRIRDDQVTARDVLLDRLRGYCSPRFRAWLYVSKDGWPVERRILVRGVSAPVTFDRPGWLPISVGWRAPEGRYESSVLQTQTLFPTTGPLGGLTYPITYPITYAAGNVANAATVTNAGTVESLPYVDVYGYCTDPVIKNLTTGKQFAFKGLTVQAGDFIRVDMKQRVALLTNDAGQSRYSLVDFTSSNWWGLDPGSSLVAFLPGNPGASCQAQISFRDTMI